MKNLKKQGCYTKKKKKCLCFLIEKDYYENLDLHNATDTKRFGK